MEYWRLAVFQRGKLMKLSLKSSLLGLMTLSLLSGLTVHAQQSVPVAAKVIAALENQWLKSQQTNSPDLAFPLLASKFMYTSETGKLMDKAQYLADAKATKYASMNYAGMMIEVFGDTVIARGEARYTGTDSSGKGMDGAVRFTDTWVRMHRGKWECVASHVSNVSK